MWGARREGRGRGHSAKGVSRPFYHVNKDPTAIEVEEDKKSVQTPVTSESFPQLYSQVLSSKLAALELLPNCISGFLHENSV